MHLPDINVWLALAFVTHVHHNSAQAWLDGLPGDRRCYFCRFTQQGFLRLANNPKVFPQAGVTQDLAWKLYDTMLSDTRIEFASEPPSFTNADGLALAAQSAARDRDARQSGEEPSPSCRR